MGRQISWTEKSDQELLALYRKGSQEACACLLARYANLINRRISAVQIRGIERDDLRQEAYMGLLGAVRSYDEAKNSSFGAYASFCIANSLKNLFAAASTKKADLYRKTISLQESGLENLYGAEDTNPEARMIAEESYAGLRRLLSEVLTPLEQEVLRLYFSGCSYHETAARLHVSPKSVDNALQRVRRKLKAALNEL